MNKLCVFFICMALSSCFKQKAPTIDNDSKFLIENRERLVACENTDFDKGLLLHTNVVNLFVCTKWATIFPKLYESLVLIDKNAWDHLLGPVGSEFFDNRARRNRVIKKLNDLDKRGGLDDLSNVITALNDTNFYDSINEIFLCSDYPNREECEKRGDNKFKQEDLVNIIDSINFKSKDYADISIILEELSVALSGNADAIKSEVNKFFNKKEFIPKRISLISSFAEKFIRGLDQKEKNLFGKIFSTIGIDEKTTWIEGWTKKAINSNDFHILANYSNLKYKNVLSDAVLLNDAMKRNIKCEYFSKDKAQIILVKENLEVMLYDLEKSSLRGAQKVLLKTLNLITMGSEFCPTLKNYTLAVDVKDNSSLSFVKSLSQMSAFLNTPAYFDLFKYILNIFIANKSGPDPLYLIHLLNDDVAKSALDLNKLMFKYSPDFYKVFYQVLTNLSSRGWGALGHLSERAFTKDKENHYRQLSKVWLFFTNSEKNFLFNFIDQHLKTETDYVLLLNFYSKIINELVDAGPSIMHKLASDVPARLNTVNAIRNLANHLSGEDDLREFKHFFSRDHIIEIIKVVTRGVDIQRLAAGELAALDEELHRRNTQQRYYLITASPEGENSKDIAQCISKIASGDVKFNSLLVSLPFECSSLSEVDITMRLMQWANVINKKFTEGRHAEEIDTGGSLFDERGLFSAGIMNSFIAINKVIDEIFSYTHDGKRVGGLEYLISAISDHLFEKQYGSKTGLLSDVTSISNTASAYLKITPAENIKWRNDLIKKVASKDNFKEMLPFIGRIGYVIQDYGAFIETQAYKKNVNIKFTEEGSSKCNEVLNKKIGGVVCPSPDIVKIIINKTLHNITRSNDKQMPTALKMLLDAMLPEQGLSIPLNGKNTYKKRMTISETLKMIYQLSDKNLEINNLQIPYRENSKSDYAYINALKDSSIKDGQRGCIPLKDKYKYIKERMTTLERIEVVIRDVRFDENFLGAQYKNAVAKGKDYNKVVASRKKLFSMCVGAHLCGKCFSHDELRMGKNAVHAFDGLADANLKEDFRYGDYMKSLLSILVGSSKKSTQSSKVISVPVISKKSLKKHNGQILTHISMVAAFSNIARVLRDRVGPRLEDLSLLMKKKEFKLINYHLLEGINSEELEKELSFLITKVLKVKNSSDDSLVDKGVDWINSLEYNNLRLLEKLAVNTLSLATYIGLPSFMYTDIFKFKKERNLYKDKNLLMVVELLNSVVSFWPFLEKSLPDNFKLENMISPAHNLVEYYLEKLMQDDDPSYNVHYKVLNDMVGVTYRFIVGKNKAGAKILGEFFGKIPLVSDLIISLQSFYQYLVKQHKTDLFQVAGKNIYKFTQADDVELEPLRNYLFKSTLPMECNSDLNSCKKYFHFDEPAQLQIFLSRKDPGHKVNIERFLITIFGKERENLIELINKVIPRLKIEKIPENL